MGEWQSAPSGQGQRLVLLTETGAEGICGVLDTPRMAHTPPEILRFRLVAIICKQNLADDCDALRTDSLVKLALGPAP